MFDDFAESIGSAFVVVDYSEVIKSTTICSFLSFFGFILIMSIYWTTPSVRNKIAFRMVMNLGITSFTMCCARWISYNPDKLDGYLCYIFGALNQFSVLSTICWLIMLRIIVYDLLIAQNYRALFAEKRNYLVSYGIPLLFTLMPALLGLYGSDGITCWISTKTNQLGTLIFYHGPVFLAFGGYTYLFLQLFKKRRQIGNMNEKDKKLILQFRFYSIPLFLMMLVSCVHQIYFIIYPQGSASWVWIMVSVVYQSQTFMIAVIFVLNPSVRSKVRKNIRNGCCWRKEKSDKVYYFSIDSDSRGSGTLGTSFGTSLGSSMGTSGFKNQLKIRVENNDLL